MDNIPSRGFTKLDSGIVDSTLWMKENDVLRVWIALLAKCDAYGFVRAAVPSMAHLCFTTIERFEQIIDELCAPDPHSRSHDNEGRRLQVIEGGWCILNYIRYRDLMQRKAQSHAERQNAYRKRLKERDSIVTPPVTRDTEAEAEAEAKKQEHVRQVARFDAFWSLYPVKKAKQAAKKAWLRLAPDDALAGTIMHRLDEQVARDDDWLRGFAPHGATYLNGRRWEDVIAVAKVSNVTVVSGPAHNPGGTSPAKPETPESRAQAQRDFEAHLRELGQPVQ
jgi:hypothetical protein